MRRRACEISATYRNVALSGALDDGDNFVAEMALWAVGEREDPIYTAKICQIASTHPEPLVREAAIAALGAIGDRSGLETVLRALRDKPNIRRRAAVALAAFEGDEVTSALEACLADRDWQVRQIAEDLLEITSGTQD